MALRFVLTLIAAVLVAGCRSAPVAEPGVIGLVDTYYTTDPDTGRLVEGCPESGPVTVVFDTVAVEGERLTIRGTAEIEGRGGHGSALLAAGYQRTGIPEMPAPPPAGRPHPTAGRPLPDTALAYGATLYRGGGFELRAPLDEAAGDVLQIAYGCVDIDDWIRVPVADLLAGTRFVASEPGAVPNPEARGVDGLRLRPLDRTVAPGDSARFVLSYRAPPPSTMFPPPPGQEATSPSFGVACLWRLERWDGGWQTAPLRSWADPDDLRYGCTAQGLRFVERGERREGFRLQPGAEPGRYRWCLDTATDRGERLVERTACSTAVVVR